MSDEVENQEEVLIEEPIIQDELQLLKDRAKLMGIRFHPSIKIPKLKEKIEAAAKNSNVQEAIKSIETVAKNTSSNPRENFKGFAPETLQERRIRLKKEASEMVRVRVSNMNPNKKESEGDIYTVSNSMVGTYKKFIPYNNDIGWYVPKMILGYLQEKQCQVFYTVRNNRGAKVRKGKLIKELAIEIMPNLSLSELKELAAQQALAHSID